jgi:hypothetical protein
MAEILEVEARLKDFISANLDNIIKKIETASTTIKSQSKAASELTEKNNALNDTVGKLGKTLIGLFAFEKVKNFLVDCYKAAKEQQLIQLQLNTALGYYSVILKKQSEELSKKLLIDDDEIVSAQQRLANYIKDEDAIKRLIPAVIDLSRAKGGSMGLSQAADLVARGISDDSEELGRLKIKVEGANGSIERINSVIVGLNANFGGQAQAIGECNGLVEALGIGYDELKEKIGGFFRKDTAEDLYETNKKLLDQLKSPGFNMQKLLAVDPKDRDVLQKAIDDYEKNLNEKKEHAEIDANAKKIKRIAEETQKLETEYNKLSSEGRVKILREELDKQLKLHAGNLDQIELLKKTYTIKISQEKGKDAAGIDGETEVERIKRTTEIQREYMEKQGEIVNGRISKDAEILESARFTWDNLNEIEELGTQLSAEQSEKRIKQTQFEKEAKLGAATSFLNGFSQLLSVAGSKSKAAANAAKVLAIGETIINTSVASVKAFKYGWDAGVTPYDRAVLAGLYMAGAMAAGTAQVALIASQKFATGTMRATGGLSIVGEMGPEIMDVPSGARIYSALETRNMINNVSNNNTNNSGVSNVYFTISDEVTGNKLRKMLHGGELDTFVSDFKKYARA